MATTIKIKNSATPSSTPSSLEQGEMALNVTDGKLFYGSGSGNDVKEFTGGGTTIDTGSFATTGSNTFIGDQIISGNLDVTGSATLTGITYPTTDGDNGDIIFTDGAGVLSFGKTTVYASVKNVSGGTLSKGMPVHASSSVGNTNEVIVASASNAATMPATFILAQQLNDEEEGLGIVTGFINGVDTSGFQEGQVLYVGENGGYTNIKPSGSNLIQNLGIVTKIDATNGSGFIYGSGRANDTPNLLENHIFFGSGSNQQYQLHISGALDQTVINNITASGNISASGLITALSSSIDYLAVNDKLQGNGSGFQFFAFNEDTVKVKFANWYSSNDRQYGMGQLWFETWFAAIDNNADPALRDERRIGFYLEEPDAGASDAVGGGGVHPSNARFYVDVNGAYLSGSLTASADISASGDVYGDTFIVNEITASGNISGSQTGSFAYLQLPGFEFESAAASTELVVNGDISASGHISSSNLSINGFPDVSASLAAASGGGGGGDIFNVSVSFRANASVQDRYYFGTTSYGWNYVIWTLNATTFTSVFYGNCHNGIPVPANFTEAYVRGVVKNSVAGNDYTFELWKTPNPNGVASSVSTTLLASQNLTLTTNNVHYKIDMSATGLTINEDDLLFYTVRRTTGGSATNNTDTSITITLK